MKAFATPLLFVFLALLNGCTFNVSMAHTDGKAIDVIDDNASATPNVAPNVNISGLTTL